MGISIKYAKWDGIEKKIRSSIITNTYGVWLQRIQYIFTTMVPWKIRKPEDFLIVKQHWLNARVWHDFSELSTGKITHCTAKCLYILFSHRHRYCMIFIDMLLFYTQSMYCIVLLMNYIVYIYCNIGLYSMWVSTWEDVSKDVVEATFAHGLNIVSSDFVPRWADRFNELSSGRSGRLLDIRSPYDSRLKLSKMLARAWGGCAPQMWQCTMLAPSLFPARTHVHVLLQKQDSERSEEALAFWNWDKKDKEYANIFKLLVTSHIWLEWLSFNWTRICFKT